MKHVLRETQWKVTLTTAGPQPQSIDKNVEAPTQDVATRRAMQAFPGMSFTQVQVTSLQPQQTPPGTQTPVQRQQQLPRQMAALQPLQGLRMPGQQQQQQMVAAEGIDPKRFSYPYAIVLPVHFARVLNEASPVSVTENHGQYQMVLESAVHMQEFLLRLGQNRNRNAVSAIVNGIRSSMK